MIIEFDKSFSKSLDKINDKTTLKKVSKTIDLIETKNAIIDIPNTKKMVGFTSYFRIKIGNYRIGFEKINDSTIRFIIICHRKDIYNKFP